MRTHPGGDLSLPKTVINRARRDVIQAMVECSSLGGRLF